MNVCAGTITSSCAPTPAACSMMVSAAVPDPTPTQWRHLAVRGELGLELLDLLAEDERARGDYAVEGLPQVVDDSRMLSAQIDKWHRGHACPTSPRGSVRERPPVRGAARNAKAWPMGWEACYAKLHELRAGGRQARFRACGGRMCNYRTACGRSYGHHDCHGRQGSRPVEAALGRSFPATCHTNSRFSIEAVTKAPGENTTARAGSGMLRPARPLTVTVARSGRRQPRACIVNNRTSPAFTTNMCGGSTASSPIASETATPQRT